MNLSTAIQGAITSDGGVSADYTLVLVISVCGFLIITLAGFAFNSINNNIKTMRDDFTEFRKDFHEFVQMQAGINARMEERTKDK